MTFGHSTDFGTMSPESLRKRAGKGAHLACDLARAKQHSSVRGMKLQFDCLSRQPRYFQQAREAYSVPGHGRKAGHA